MDGHSIRIDKLTTDLIVLEQAIHNEEVFVHGIENVAYWSQWCGSTAEIWGRHNIDRSADWNAIFTHQSTVHLETRRRTIPPSCEVFIVTTVQCDLAIWRGYIATIRLSKLSNGRGACPVSRNPLPEDANPPPSMEEFVDRWIVDKTWLQPSRTNQEIAAD